jgi:hypothetical protein
MTPLEAWPIIAASAIVVFGCGQLVEKVKTSRIDKLKERMNGTFVRADLCASYRDSENQRWDTLKATLDKLDAWVEKQKDK